MAALECAQLPSRGARPSQINYRGLLMSNTNETVASLNLLAAEMSLLKHPFYQQWAAGTLSAQRLGNYAIQYYRHVEAFPRYLSALHSRCEDLETRYCSKTSSTRSAAPRTIRNSGSGLQR